MPSQQILHALLLYDAETGIFVRKKRVENTLTDKMWNTRLANKEAGTKLLKSVVVYVESIPYAAHRLAYVYVHGDVLDTSMQVDHINGNPFDNCITNLRLATHAQNCSNARVRKNRTLPKGVYANNIRYKAMIQVNKLPIYLGTFDTPEDAHKAYGEAAKKYHGEFARVS